MSTGICAHCGAQLPNAAGPGICCDECGEPVAPETRLVRVPADEAHVHAIPRGPLFEVVRAAQAWSGRLRERAQERAEGREPYEHLVEAADRIDRAARDLDRRLGAAPALDA